MPSIRAPKQVFFRTGLHLKAAPAFIFAKNAEKVRERLVVILDAHTICEK